MYEVFEKLMRLKGVTAYRVSKDTGVTQTSLSNWKNGKSEPSNENIKKLADYFGVSIDYLMTGREADKEGGYYLDDEARELAQFLFENPEYRVLFDASRKVKKEDIAFVKELIDRTTR